MTGSTSAARVSSSATIHARLRSEILGGTYAPGDPLPSERALSEQLDVSRHVVREAIKRLLQAGLVEIAHGGATRVRDWRAAGGLDLLADLTRHKTTELEQFLRSAAEMRASLGADAARLAATRASDEQRATLRLLATRAAEPGLAQMERLERYEAIWAAILDASENVAYRLAYNSLVAARETGAVDPAVYRRELADPAAIRDMTAAVADGDPQRAYERARELLNRTVEEAT